jgi:hypothetical protein
MEEKRRRVLLALYHLSSTKSPHVDTDDLAALADVGRDFYDILRHLGMKGKGWLNWANRVVRITPEGTEKAEDIIKMQMLEKQRKVLEKIYELGGPNHTKLVLINVLQSELGMTSRELLPIINDLEDNKGLLGGGVDEAVCLTPAGVIEVESPSSGSKDGGTTIHNIFQGPFQGGIQQGGQNNVQNNTFNNNPKLEENINRLIELLRASSLSQLDKDDIVHDVERFKQLAQQKDAPGALERAQKKLEAVKTGIEVADSGGELIGKALPYITALWQLITTLNS